MINTNYINDIHQYPSAWVGHAEIAVFLVNSFNPNVIVDLGVDYRNTYEIVLNKYNQLKERYSIDNIEFIKSDFNDLAKIWDKQIDILHIDGLHTYEAVKLDFDTWSKFTNENSIILFHDVEAFPDSVGKFFSELGGHKLIHTGSAGLGIYTQNINNLLKIKEFIDKC